MLMLCQYVNDEKIVMRKLKKVSLIKRNLQYIDSTGVV